MFDLGLLFSLALLSSIMLTKILIKQLTLYGIVDKPNYRRSHKNITPRGGGLAFVIIFSIGLPIFEYLNTGTVTRSGRLIPPLLAISAVSFWDDIKTVPVIVRFIVHLTCSGIAAYLFLFKNNITDPRFALIGFLVLSIALATFLNLYNFLDGIDGITGAQSIHLTLTIILLCYLKQDIIAYTGLILTIAVITLGYSIGFMLFNWHPAGIFMGDVGSISIGFLLGLCLLMIGTSSYHLLISMIIATLYYTADGGLTLVIRIVKKEKFWQAHLNHFFQQAVKKGITQKKVVLGIVLCNLHLMVLAVSALYYPITSMIIATIIVAITLIRFKVSATTI